MANNKVIYYGETLIDLTSDTVTADKLLTNITAHDKSGTIITGTCDFDSNTQDATATMDEILIGKTAYARGAKITGTMPDNGSIDENITTVAEQISIPQGYHDGGGKVQISSVEQSKIIPSNIKQGIVILGVTGELEPSSDVTAQAKTATPAKTEQVILPDEGYDYLSQVTVAAIPYSTSENAAGGTTVTIGA